LAGLSLFWFPADYPTDWSLQYLAVTGGVWCLEGLGLRIFVVWLVLNSFIVQTFLGCPKSLYGGKHEDLGVPKK
jgi:hypothetical protein